MSEVINPGDRIINPKERFKTNSLSMKLPRTAEAIRSRELLEKVRKMRDSRL